MMFHRLRHDVIDCLNQGIGSISGPSVARICIRLKKDFRVFILVVVTSSRIGGILESGLNENLVRLRIRTSQRAVIHVHSKDGKIVATSQSFNNL